MLGVIEKVLWGIFQLPVRGRTVADRGDRGKGLETIFEI
jgi:hypothetical protein